eukprot:m.211252 g.211252  ORF g.211252 m.211252 type:complete len:72 (+) comp19025_c0_seq2:691-906(+)
MCRFIIARKKCECPARTVAASSGTALCGQDSECDSSHFPNPTTVEIRLKLVLILQKFEIETTYKMDSHCSM